VIAWSLYLLFMYLLFMTARSEGGFWLPLFAVCILPVIVYFLRRRPKKVGWGEYWNFLAKLNFASPFILCLSSPMDEAWQLLHHMREIPNPLAPKSSLAPYLWKSRKAYVRRSCEVGRIQGVALFIDQTMSVRIVVVAMWLIILLLVTFLIALYVFMALYPGRIETDLPWEGVAGALVIWLGLATSLTFVFGTSFFSAISTPIRWLSRQLWASSRLLNDIGTYVARCRAWSLLQEMAFGLEGYVFELPKAEREPKFACQAIYKYEDLPKNVEERALTRRDEWISRTFGAFTETFAKLVVTASDLSSLQKTVETDLSLVHAAYYTDVECIERIADWIAGKARSAEVAAAPSDTVRLAS
jgi:hypothetical protein